MYVCECAFGGWVCLLEGGVCWTGVCVLAVLSVVWVSEVC